MNETWKQAAGFENYEVSSEGRVRRLTSATSTSAGRILKASMHYRGYLHHGLSRDGKVITVRLNRLVCETFHGCAPSPDHQAAHRNGDARDNRATNLYWATKVENERDKDRHGTRRRGTAVGHARLTEGIVADIRRRQRHERLSPKQLSEELGLPIGPIQHVLKGRSWRHVSVQP